MKQRSETSRRKSSVGRFSAKRLGGLVLPITTPFKSRLNTSGKKQGAHEDVDVRALRANIKRWNETGIVGYVILGSTGERVHLDAREYVRVIEIAREEVPSDLAFIVGAGQQSTRATINEIRTAAVAGAEAVLVITPHFYRSAVTQEALNEHYKRVADNSPVPVILYSVPALTGIKIQSETIARLSEHENIIGIKDSSADIHGLTETVKLVKERSKTASGDFAILTGNGTVLYDSLLGEASGAILAVGCVAPRLCIEIIRAVQSGNHERASALQEKLTPLAQAVTTTYGIAGLKAALEIIGYAGGAARAPLKPADEEAREEIHRMLHEALACLDDHASRQSGHKRNASRMSAHSAEPLVEEDSSLVEPARPA